MTAMLTAPAATPLLPVVTIGEHRLVPTVNEAARLPFGWTCSCGEFDTNLDRQSDVAAIMAAHVQEVLAEAAGVTCLDL